MAQRIERQIAVTFDGNQALRIAQAEIVTDPEAGTVDIRMHSEGQTALGLLQLMESNEIVTLSLGVIPAANPNS